MKKETLIYMFILFIALAAGCSSGAGNLILPDGTSSIPDLPTIEVQKDESSRQLLGIWDFIFDLETQMVQVIPNRELMTHEKIDISSAAPQISNYNFNPLTGIVDVDVSLKNPDTRDFYDYRLIVYTNNNVRILLNYDDWTALWDIPGGTTLNPFIAYAKRQPKRLFPANARFTEHCQFYLPTGSGTVTAAVDVSNDGNCLEPYEIADFKLLEPLYDFMYSSAEAEVEVRDWQNDVNQVYLYCGAVTGSNWETFTYLGNNKWRLEIVNRMNASDGNYIGVIQARSAGTTVALYDVVSISVEKYPVSADWTFLVYLHEADLHPFDDEDINEMEKVGSVENNLEVIVLWNKTDTVDDVILRIEKDNDESNVTSPEIDDNGEVIPSGGLDMGDQKTLEDFLRWSIKNYPAKNYGLIFWDHGDGPFGIVPESVIPKMCCGGLSIWEIRNACQTVLNEHPQLSKLEFIGFDACLMSWLETAYCIKDVCKSAIASEMLEPGQGWKYDPPLEYLINNINSATTDDICEQFALAYINSVSGDRTIAAWRCSNINTAVIPALNTFAGELKNALSTYKTQIHNDWNDSGSWGSDCGSSFIKDLGYFAHLIGNDQNLPASLRNSAQSLETGIENAMIFHSHTGSGSGCHYDETGWQIWAPDNYDDSEWNDERYDYFSLGFSETQWDEFLDAFDD